jgi:cellulose 1,4-beta-cellobiosidase
VSDTSVTGVDARTQGTEWVALTATNWGYWVHNPDGSPISFPISIRVSSPKGELIFNDLFDSVASAGKTYDTHASFAGAPTEAPTASKAVRSGSDVVTITQIPAKAVDGGTHFNVVITNTGDQVLTELVLSSTGAFTDTWGIVFKDNAFTFPSYVATAGGVQPGKSFRWSYITPGGEPAEFLITSAVFGSRDNANKQEQEAEQQKQKEQSNIQERGPPETTTGPLPETATGNPFAGAAFFIPPYYTAQVQATVNENTGMSSLASLLNAPVAFWLDNIAKVGTLSSVLSAARGTQASTGVPTVVTIVIYDLPNRDCAALASNGEIRCADSSCTEGINKYKTEYIDPIIATLRDFTDLRIAAIVEPDSLPNLVTNLGVPKCAQSESVYKTCVAYAIQQLATLPNVAIYVDAAHGGWMGWQTNLAGLASIFQEVLTLAGGVDKIRGFATNVANLQPLGSLDSTDDPCKLKEQSNLAINEVTYTKLLTAALEAVGISNKAFIIDTSRNGVINARSSCSNWCNINNAGLGVRPTAAPAGLGVSNIDALLWVKPPGESDGTSDTTAARYDAHCGSVDSVQPAPEAGQWFPSYFTMLATNANPPL